MHRGPAVLHGCTVKIWCGKNRGPTWDYDRCYVRILDVPTLASSLDVETSSITSEARVWGHQASGSLDVNRTGSQLFCSQTGPRPA